MSNPYLKIHSVKALTENEIENRLLRVNRHFLYYELNVCCQEFEKLLINILTIFIRDLTSRKL